VNTTKYQVTGMTCGHCERAVIAEVAQIGGVDHVDVSAATGILVVTSTIELDDGQVSAAVEEAGYSAVRF
jgi:copper chaperone